MSGLRTLGRASTLPGSLPQTNLSMARPRRLLVLLAIGTLLMLVGPLEHPASILAQEDSLEQRAQSLDKQLICPVCPGETLNQSQATLAKQMRQIIRERLADGQPEQEIIDYFVSVYGESVLAAPPRSGFSLTVWLVPPVGLTGGLVVLFLAIRTLRRGARTPAGAGGSASPQAGEEASTDPELERYLSLVDREMGERPGPSDQGQERG